MVTVTETGCKNTKPLFQNVKHGEKNLVVQKSFRNFAASLSIAGV